VAVITITGEKGTGSWNLVRRLAKRIDYDYIGEDLKREIAKELKLSESEVEVFRQASQSRLIRKLDRYTCTLVQKVVDRERGCLDDQDFYDATVKLVSKLYEGGNLVIHNWGAQCILKDSPDTVHVLVHRDLEKKIDAAMADYDLSSSAARKMVMDDEQNMVQYLKQFFDADINDARLYNMIIDLDDAGPDRAVDMIVDHIKRSGGE
jgi:cytidylate kinase